VTRRILIALIALTAALLVAAVVPLALQAAAHERDAFIDDAQATAHSVAEIAEEKLGDNAADPALTAALLNAARQHDVLLLLNSAGHVVAHRGQPPRDWAALAAQATQSGDLTKMTKDSVIVAEPVLNDRNISGASIGTVVLQRSLNSLNANIANLWLYVTVLGGAALIAAALIAITFARWVSKPLVTMDAAARRLADGNLAVRAPAGSGPPELRRMAATFNMMAGRLETLVHAHGVMLADVSHQLRTPLAALRLRIDLLAADSGPAAAAELAGAQGEIARLSRLVDGLLAVARAESVTEQVVSMNLIPAVTERVSAWQPVADGHDVKLVVQAAGSVDRPRIALGVGHLEQILDNLLANAIDALAEGGTVTVTVSSSEGGSTLVVADDGPGMTEQERSRAFMRFTSGSANGTGLGLAIVHRLVTSNGGTARLAETPGGGLTVSIEFPDTILHEGTNSAAP
jgi:signal transduction histidine kinase